MISFVSKVIWFIWSSFAPEQAKADLESVFKDFFKMLALLILLAFAFGAAFFAGLYFLAQWLITYIEYPIACYFIAASVSMLFTLLTIVVLFRYIIMRFLKRAHNKGDNILNAFTFKK
jgi:uncharacterized protein HemY